MALKLKLRLIRSGGAVTSDDFGHARDDRAAEAVRVLDRNDSHRFWFEPLPGCGRRLTRHMGNGRADSTPFAVRVFTTLMKAGVKRGAAYCHRVSVQSCAAMMRNHPLFDILLSPFFRIERLDDVVRLAKEIRE